MQKYKRRRITVKETDLVILRSERMTEEVARVAEKVSRSSGAMVIVLAPGIKIDKIPEEDQRRLCIALTKKFAGTLDQDVQVTREEESRPKILVPGRR